jgi:hypothetical protein
MKNELLTLRNVGKETLKDLELLKISSIKQLAKQDPDDIYLRLQILTHQKQDPCVRDVFAAIIHEAKTGEKTDWWAWSKIRKVYK